MQSPGVEVVLKVIGITLEAKSIMMENRPISNTPVHLSYRLFGSVAKGRLKSLQEDYEAQVDELQQRRNLKSDHPAALNYLEFTTLYTALQLRNFLRYDSLLDAAADGPMFLSSCEAKQIIIDSWLHIAKQYQLIVYAISVMSNHVHVLLCTEKEEAEVDLEMVMERHKKFAGNQLNKLQHVKGRRVWAEKVFDRDVREGRFTSALWYVLNNPKKAGLTENVLTWCGNWFNPILEQEYIGPQRWRFDARTPHSPSAE